MYYAAMYSKLAIAEHNMYDDPKYDLGEVELPYPVEANSTTGRAKKWIFHELEVCITDYFYDVC